MSGIREKISEIYSLEELSRQDSYIHRLHPFAKIAAVFGYIICIASFGRYDFLALLPYIFFPVFIIYLANIPLPMIVKRTLWALPFCLFIGVSNIILDTAFFYRLGSYDITYGELSFLTIILRTILCVSAILILVAVTPFPELTRQLRHMHFPDILVTLFEMTYRYIGVLSEEAYNMLTAYKLRNPKTKGLEMKDMGSFAGQLLLRSFDRAERVYQAMKCRGYNSKEFVYKYRKLRGQDMLFIAAVCISIIFLRFCTFQILQRGAGL